MSAAYYSDSGCRLATGSSIRRSKKRGERIPDRRGRQREEFLPYPSPGTFGSRNAVWLFEKRATANSILHMILDSPLGTDENARFFARDIDHILRALRISVSELARVCDVSRQTVHGWINGGEPSPRNARRVSELARATDVLLESQIEIAPQALRRKIDGGPSLLESLREGGQTVELARKLAETLSRESQQRKRLAERLARRGKADFASFRFGAPHLAEDS